MERYEVYYLGGHVGRWRGFGLSPIAWLVPELVSDLITRDWRHSINFLRLDRGPRIYMFPGQQVMNPTSVLFMKRALGNYLTKWAMIVLPMLTVRLAVAQFVEVKTEIQVSDWDYMFLVDRVATNLASASQQSIFTGSGTTRCVIGPDVWMIEGSYPSFDVTRWFTGTNIIEHTVIKQQTPDAIVAKMRERTGIVTEAAPSGKRYTKIYASLDGNPGRPVRVADLMGFDIGARVSWLAFCSGSTLKREGRKIYPPSVFWKESSIAFSGWSDEVEVFKDDLGLPRSINLVSTNGQSIFQYQVHQSTNLNGWSVPLEFYGVQYLPTRTNLWKLHLTFKGRVTAIGSASKPEISPEVMNVIER